MVTHSRQQEFYFDSKLNLRRHDYRVDLAGGVASAQLVDEVVEIEGIRVPTRRRACVRGPDNQPVRNLLMVSIDLSDIAFD